MNGMSTKQWWLDAAEIVDAWRVFPRVFMLLYIWILYQVHLWYTLQAQTAWPDVYANLVWGVCGVMTGFYVQSGRKWGG